MRDFPAFFIRALPFVSGMALLLIALCFLTQFADDAYRLSRLDSDALWAFLPFFFVGAPLTLFGAIRLASQNAEAINNASPTKTTAATSGCS